MFFRQLCAVLISVPVTCLGATVLADFESGGLSGWSSTGTAWTVGGTTGTTPNILPAQGSLFARSGAPNSSSGPLSENNIGILTSPGFTVAYDTFSWIDAGWSGSINNNLNYFQILDSSQTLVAQFASSQTDSWTPRSTNLISIGLSPGETFYFRAVDGNSALGYSWVAFDDLQLSGNAVAPVPEPGTLVTVLAGLAAAFGVRRCRQRA